VINHEDLHDNQNLYLKVAGNSSEVLHVSSLAHCRKVKIRESGSQSLTSALQELLCFRMH